ncbi:MAG: hypothetical protein WCJ72_13440 [Chryseobacterium sp.]
MIIKGKLQNTNNVTILEFGDGSILIQGGLIPKTGTKLIMFKNKAPGAIGLSKSELTNSDEFEPEIALSFKNMESFDAVYDYMTLMKNIYLQEMINKEDK